MKDKVIEAGAIFLALIWFCLGYEDNTKAGDKKKAEVISTILEKLDSPTGLYIPPGMWRSMIEKALPLGVDGVVLLLNKFGVFKKSSE